MSGKRKILLVAVWVVAAFLMAAVWIWRPVSNLVADELFLTGLFVGFVAGRRNR